MERRGNGLNDGAEEVAPLSLQAYGALVTSTKWKGEVSSRPGEGAVES
jgi:hypothetical protein